jgi:hypothetical protein
MQTSYVRHDHRERHRYRSRLCARQHGRDHRVLGRREMSDLSPQSGPKRTLIRSRFRSRCVAAIGWVTTGRPLTMLRAARPIGGKRRSISDDSG